MASSDHAIVVGISEYPKHPTLASRLGSENDVEEIVRWLADPGGGDVPAGHIHVLQTNNFPDRTRPRKEDVLDAFGRFLTMARSTDDFAPVGRRLYIFMAGHGIGIELQVTALLMANFAAGEYGHHVCGTFVANHFVEEGFFDEIVLLMDCCADDTHETFPRHLPWQRVRQGPPSQTRWLYGYASSFGHEAHEMVLDGKVRGAFTTAVIDALRTGAQDSKSIESTVAARFCELYESDDESGPSFQHGSGIVEFGQPVPKRVLGVTLNDAGRDANVTVQVGLGNGTVLAEESMAAGETWQTELTGGLYEITRTDTNQSTMVNIHMKDGHVEI